MPQGLRPVAFNRRYQILQRLTGAVRSVRHPFEISYDPDAI